MRFYGDPDWFIEVLSFMSNNCKILFYSCLFSSNFWASRHYTVVTTVHYCALDYRQDKVQTQQS